GIAKKIEEERGQQTEDDGGGPPLHEQRRRREDHHRNDEEPPLRSEPDFWHASILMQRRFPDKALNAECRTQNEERGRSSQGVPPWETRLDDFVGRRRGHVCGF